MLGNVAGVSPATAAAATHPGSALAAKKKAGKGTLKIVVTGSGSYTVTGKGFRKTGSASRSFKVKPGRYIVKSSAGSVTPGTVKVRKGKVLQVRVTFPQAVTPAPTPTPALTPTPNPTIAPSPDPTVAPTSTPTPTPTLTPGMTGDVQRVSTNASGGQANGQPYSDPVWSPDGTRVAFLSDADDLVPGDTNNATDVFVKTLASGVIQRVSTDAAGAQGNRDAADGPSWSPDGSKIAFTSRATNLVPDDFMGAEDVFIKTLATGAIERISTDATGFQADGSSYDPAWSPDGTKVAFDSEAENLVPDDTNNTTDIFVKTLATGAIQRISTDAAGGQASGGMWGVHFSSDPAWSPDSTKVAFLSSVDNLVPGDTNNATDAFVKTLATGAIQRISTDASGSQSNEDCSYGLSWSPDGTKIAFTSDASNLVPGDTNSDPDVFIKTIGTGSIELISTNSTGTQGNGDSYGPVSWSPDGSRIAFTSFAANLVPGDANNAPDVFVKTLATGASQLISADATGAQGDASSDDPAWSPEGTKIAFLSVADNLVPGDTNGMNDVFVKTLP